MSFSVEKVGEDSGGSGSGNIFQIKNQAYKVGCGIPVKTDVSVNALQRIKD